jgi:wobble nucleotide-excising tRNase
MCPFCRQDLAASDILAHYRAYFGAAYAQLKQAIADARRAITAGHAGEVPTAFERAVRLAAERRQFWSRFTEVPEVAIDTAALARDWRQAREAIEAALIAKQSTPLEPLVLDQNARAAIGRYHETRETIRELSAALLAVNPQLAIVKEQAQVADIPALSADIATLKATQARHSAELVPLCREYLDEKQAKAATERLRTAARTALDNYRQNIFPLYEGAINTYLQRFGAAFRLQGMASVNNRGGSSVNYSVLINQNAVPLSANGAPSFRSALSAGDRNTLALAFFFASLEQDPALADKIVVIDDPMTSLDEHRSLVTVQEIATLAGRVSQVIGLSHHKPFLMNLWESMPRNHPRAALRITRVGNASQIVAWNVSADTVTEHDRRHARVLAYLAAADHTTERQVAADLRPMLEALVRVAYPNAFPPGALLGPFINVCEQRLNTPDQLLDQAATRELGAILEYANLFHHDSNPTCQTEIINDQQLTSFARRTLEFIRR